MNLELLGTSVGAAAYAGTAAGPARTSEPEQIEISAGKGFEIGSWLPVIAPSTLLPALAFYFGWTCTNAMLSYFGVDPSVLGLSAQDYALRSADVLFIPAGALLSVALLAVCGHSLAMARMRRDPGTYAWVEPVMAGVGSVLFVVGAAAAWHGLPFTVPGYQLFPGVGAGLLGYGTVLGRSRRRTRDPRRPGPVEARGHEHRVLAGTLMGLLMVLSLFWAATDYARALGTGRAEAVAAQLAQQPAVVVYAKQRLRLGAPNVVETAVGDSASIYKFSYRGLRLVFGTAQSYLLVPVGWSRSTGVAVILSKSDSVRLEFETVGLT